MKNYQHENITPSERLLSWIRIHHNQGPSNVAPHWHRSIELSFTYQGQIDAFTIGQETYRTSAGKILVVNSQEIHSVRVQRQMISETECALSLTYPYAFVLGQYADIDDYKIAINTTENFSPSQKAAYQRLQTQLAQVIQLYQGQDPLRTLKLNRLILDILIELLENFLEKRPEHQSLDGDLQVAQRLQWLTQYVQDHYQEDIGLDKLAQLCHLSKTYLARFVKQHLGLTLGDYINKVRAENARQALIATQENFTTIALDSGFSGLRTMNRALEKYFGANARQLRQTTKKGKLS